MRLFISGPIDDRHSWELQRFETIADDLKRLGFQASVLTRIVPPSMEHGSAMKIRLSELLRCDGLALMPSWRTSEDCVTEVRCAIACEMNVMPAEAWLERGRSEPED